MAGRRLNPNPAETQPMNELIDPALAMPLAPPMSPIQPPSPEQLAMAPTLFPMEDQPFAAFHGEEGEEGQPGSEEQEEALTDEERLQFATLMTIGRRSKTITVFDHNVVIESLTIADDMRIGLFCRDYKDAPPADSRAFQVAVCACAIRSIDGRPLYQPLSDEGGQDEIFHEKIEKLKNWYAPVITEIYHYVLDLDREFAELAERLKKLRA